MMKTILEFQQQNRVWHCVILDNGSNDDTGLQARKIVDKDSRVRYVYQQKQSIDVAQQNAKDLCLFEAIHFIEIEE